MYAWNSMYLSIIVNENFPTPVESQRGGHSSDRKSRNHLLSLLFLSFMASLRSGARKPYSVGSGLIHSIPSSYSLHLSGQLAQAANGCMTKLQQDLELTSHAPRPPSPLQLSPPSTANSSFQIYIMKLHLKTSMCVFPPSPPCPSRPLSVIF